MQSSCSPRTDFGAALVLVTVGLRIASSRRTKRVQEVGHHPRLAGSVGHGRTLLDTNNEALVEDVLARNPDARLLETPRRWRKRGGGLATARAVRMPTRDDEAARLAACIAARSDGEPRLLGETKLDDGTSAADS